ncbi:D-Ala-D-Ala carboxypeptidase family metallohydrolase [Kineosporia sp. NBRC 101731]|uniref:D-Ala-D-Ala carboxypeptidase family metallohydrolase n=1 Tax=Kineosporia sp. NBRC 101731 TaxID=3032199 RepID=UPI002556992F|nr:D-Ala-D-Ala carboxypeptidase family metallohydrolase [Kineosporia sp. NBRC 101731]
MTPDDATTTTDDSLRLVCPEPDRDPIAQDSPDANDRNPLSPRSDVSGDALELEKGLPDDVPGLVVVPRSPRAASATLTGTELTRRLRAIGFRIRTTGERDQAVRAFKTGWFRLGPSLMEGSVANSIMGPRASQAIDESYQRSLDGRPTMSPHFSFTQTQCPCGGHYADCRRIWPTRQSVIAAEELQATCFPDGLVPLAWCRCTGHNRAVGAAASSRHLRGDAIDIPPTVSLSRIKDLDTYTGIGVHRADGNVQHVDLRQGSPAEPAVWYYA